MLQLNQLHHAVFGGAPVGQPGGGGQVDIQRVLGGFRQAFQAKFQIAFVPIPATEIGMGIELIDHQL